MKNEGKIQKYPFGLVVENENSPASQSWSHSSNGTKEKDVEAEPEWSSRPVALSLGHVSSWIKQTNGPCFLFNQSQLEN